MNAKDFFGKLMSRYLLLNLLAMVVVVGLLCVGVKYGLELYTHHGEGIEVPELKGMSFQKAHLLLEEKQLIIVVADSGYNKQLPANCILAQTPGQGQRVKRGHAIYVTVNSPMSPTFALPDIVDNTSVREAEAKLTAMGFKLLPVKNVPGEKDWVYGIECRGRRVSNGERIAIDQPLTLLVGGGTFDESEDVDYVGSDYTEGTSVDAFLNGGVETDDFEEVTEPPTGANNE